MRSSYAMATTASPVFPAFPALMTSLEGSCTRTITAQTRHLPGSMSASLGHKPLVWI